MNVQHPVILSPSSVILVARCTNAAQCLTAAEPRESPYRRLAFTIAAYWLALARQQKLVDELLANCSEARIGMV
jgi:hypothetical protein